MQTQISGTITIALKKVETLTGLPVGLEVNFDKMPQASKDHVVAYGIRQILNDAMASAKNGTEAKASALKRLDNLMSGTLRASPVREGNPVRARAMELAIAKIIKSAKFIAWAQKEGVKVTDKEATKVARANAKVIIDQEGNPFMAQAEIDVAAAKALEVDELDLDFGDESDDETDESEE